MKFYITLNVHLKEKLIDTIIVHVGVNDLFNEINNKNKPIY